MKGTKMNKVKCEWIVTAQRCSTDDVYIEAVMRDGSFYNNVVNNAQYEMLVSEANEIKANHYTLI